MQKKGVKQAQGCLKNPYIMHHAISYIQFNRYLCVQALLELSHTLGLKMAQSGTI